MLLVFHSIAYLVALEGLLMSLCGIVSWYPLGDPSAAWQPLLLCGLGTLLFAAILWAVTPLRKGRREITRRDGIAIVAFGWLLACLLGALPFLFSKTITSYAAAFFEASSGLTTTGSTVLAHPEDVARGILLWRATTHLLGGIGVLVLLVAILPLAGAGGSQIVRAEAPSSGDRIEPRMTSSAKVLWGTYLLLTAFLIIALRIAGMGIFDAICHAFAAISTGGFSTHAESIEFFHSRTIDIILTVFMLLGALNFSHHYRVLRGDGLPHLRHRETLFFLGTLATAILLLTLFLRLFSPAYADASILHTLRHTAFNAISVASTTGFANTDYGTWPAIAQYLLLLLFLIGGVSGSTAGGIKSNRIFVLVQAIRTQIRLFLQPAAVLPVRQDRKVIPPSNLLAIFAFILLFALTIVIGTLVILPACPDFATATSAAAASLANTGPGFSAVGPAFTYDFFPPFQQVFLALLMIAGRLEIMTLLVLFLPSFWRR